MKSRPAESTTVSNQSPARQLDGFIARFDPALAKLVRAARRILRQRFFPTAIELVYDNYNALAIGFATTEKASGAIVSLAIYPRWVNLYFIYGASLPDPEGLLQGKGNQGRFIRLNDLALFDEPAVQQLLRAAIEDADPPLAAKGRGYTVIKMALDKRRPRRLQ